MVNAQEWLDQKYPNKEEVKYIFEVKKQLTGELIIADFPWLEEIDVYRNELTQLHLKNCSQLTYLDCGNNKLTKLTITNFPNLQKIYASYNQLTNLDLRTNTALTNLSLSFNNLTQLDLSNNQQLKVLDISYNNFFSDLSFLSHLVNLWGLYLGNNNFLVSSEPLRNLNKLETLSITNTKISQGLGYLPESVKEFSCERTKLEEQWQFQQRQQQQEEYHNSISDGGNLGDSDRNLYLDGESKMSALTQKYQDKPNFRYFQHSFNNWTSGSQEVDKFIQENQLNATAPEEIIEWIPYEKFKGIEYLAEGGFSKVYKAEWIEGPIRSWNIEDKKWERKKTYPSGMVVLKSLNNSQSITADFFQEVACYKLFRDRSIVKCYGISQNPENGDYIIVMDYILGGNMKQYLQSNNYSKLNFRSFQDKLNKLHDIAKGLDSIHKKRLIHRDLHSGNILSGNNFFYIADLGLCRPANETDKGKVYGVLPYVAPEVLQGQSYSQTSDIYSFGIIAYELFANSYPYPKLEDMDLTLKVCREYRPNINEVKIPQLLKDLINRCWDTNSTKRPNARELQETFNNWKSEIENQKNTLFYQQYKEVMVEYNNFSQNTPYKIRPMATTISKPIDTKKITQRLRQQKTEEQHIGGTEELTLDNLNIQENTQEQSSLQAQIQIPPK